MLYNAKAVTVGIVAFLVVCTSPFWAGFGSSDYTSPKVSLPKMPRNASKIRLS